jgi:hypothetical protein
MGRLGLVVSLLLSLLTAWTVPGEGALYAFWSTAQDGDIEEQTTDGICWEDVVCETNPTATTCAVQVSHALMFDVDVYMISRLSVSFNTSILAGETITSARVVMVTDEKYAYTFGVTAQLDFTSGCVGTTLDCADSSCFVSADTSIAYASWPAGGDSLSIELRPTWVATSGVTELVFKVQQEPQICSLTKDVDSNRITWRMSEYSGTASDPRLYVTTLDAGKKRTGPRTTTDNPDVWPLGRELVR